MKQHLVNKVTLLGLVILISALFLTMIHQFLMAINRWVPSQKLSFQGSVLNPEYDANFLRYQLNQYVNPEDEDVKEAYEDALSDGARNDAHVDDNNLDYSTDGSFEDYVHKLDVIL
jgi:hypothetical protein